jgi:hypothetical protein
LYEGLANAGKARGHVAKFETVGGGVEDVDLLDGRTVFDIGETAIGSGEGVEAATGLDVVAGKVARTGNRRGGTTGEGHRLLLLGGIGIVRHAEDGVQRTAGGGVEHGGNAGAGHRLGAHIGHLVGQGVGGRTVLVNGEGAAGIAAHLLDGSGDVAANGGSAGHVDVVGIIGVGIGDAGGQGGDGKGEVLDFHWSFPFRMK